MGGGYDMELGLAGKVALVTGASRGLGRAISIELAREGMHVCLVGRSTEMLREVAAEIGGLGGRCAHLAGDVTQSDTTRGAIDLTLKSFGRLDLLVNNAGTTKRGDFFSLTEADWLDGFGVKFGGALRLTRAAWPELKRTQGSIVNIIGIGGYTGTGDGAIPGAVNAALMNLTKATSQIGVRDGIRVNAVNPGRVKTDRFQRNIARLSQAWGTSEPDTYARLLRETGVARFGTPDEIASIVAFLASSRAAFIQGALIDADGGELRSL